VKWRRNLSLFLVVRNSFFSRLLIPFDMLTSRAPPDIHAARRRIQLRQVVAFCLLPPMRLALSIGRRAYRISNRHLVSRYRGKSKFRTTQSMGTMTLLTGWSTRKLSPPCRRRPCNPHARLTATIFAILWGGSQLCSNSKLNEHPESDVHGQGFIVLVPM